MCNIPVRVQCLAHPEQLSLAHQVAGVEPQVNFKPSALEYTGSESLPLIVQSKRPKHAALITKSLVEVLACTTSQL